MSIFTKKVDEINEQDLQELVEQKFAEWKSVEYKEQLAVGSESERKRFLSQISSFANASGGYLIYGVRAKDGVPEEVTGMEIANPDGEVLRLEDMARAGIRPRIPGLSIRDVTVRTNRTAIVIRVPKSWAVPHQVVFNGEFRFYSRASNGKYVLDVEELRSLFSLSETTAEQIRKFRAERLGLMVAGETPVAMNDGAKTVLHIIPTGAFDPAARFDLLPLTEQSELLEPIHPGGWSAPTHNFDGIYTHSRDKEASHSYLQIFRNGIIEAVNTSMLKPEADGRKLIAGTPFENTLRKILKKYFEIQRKLGVEPPVVIMLSLLDVKGYIMLAGTHRAFDTSHPIDRDTLLVPEVLVENMEESVDKILKPIFDAVWNACGWPGSINYEKSGNRLGDK
jgi:hypothetical protein